MKEVYDSERDRHSPNIMRDQFDQIVEQRNTRIKIKKTKEANNKRLNNLKTLKSFSRLKFKIFNHSQKQ